MGEKTKITALISKKKTIGFDSWSVSLGATEELAPHERANWRLHQALLAEDLKDLVNEQLASDVKIERRLVTRIPAFLKRLLPVP